MRKVTSPLYTRDVLRLAASIPHLVRLADPQASVSRRSPVCGSEIVVDLNLDADGRVAEIGQDVKACALGQAAAALMGRHVVGRSPAELAAARDQLAAFLDGEAPDVGDWPGLDALSHARDYPARHRSVRLAFEAAADAAEQAARARQ